MVRNEAGDLAEEVRKIDSFVHPKTKRTSQAFRVTYRDMTRRVGGGAVEESKPVESVSENGVIITLLHTIPYTDL